MEITDHGFDLMFTNIAPAAHNAFYDIERFMALIAGQATAQHKLVSRKQEVKVFLP